MRELNPCLFLDRDGTINVEKDFIGNPHELELIPGSATAIREARTLGLKVIIVSNQSGIARGLMTEDDVKNVNSRLVELLQREGAAVDAIYYCPHYSSEDDGCTCRKPSTGMFERAKTEHNVDFKRSIMVGDRITDIEAGNRIGAATMLVLTGYGKIVNEGYDGKPDHIDTVVPTLYDGMTFIRNKFNEWKSTDIGSEEAT
jgi:D-glycero-D-manno-heptose 1,7-bisphosphate phosphatase